MVAGDTVRGVESLPPRLLTPWDAKRGRLVRARQVRTLFRHSGPVLLANVGNALILDVVLWSKASHTFLVVWTSLMVLMTAVRIPLRRSYWQADPPATEAPIWERRFLAGTVVAGILWGTAGWVLSAGDLPSQFLVTFVIGGMVAGAAGSLSCHMPAFFLYLFPATLPLIVRHLLEGDSLNLGIAAMAVLFSGAFSLVARNVNRSITEIFLLRFENLELFDRFRTAIDGSEDLFIILDARLSENGDIVDFSIVELNKKAKMLLMPGNSNPIGRLMSELVPDFVSSGRLDLYAAVVANRAGREGEFLAKEGPLAGMYLVEEVVPLSDGVAVTGRDVTRRRENERRLEDAISAKESLLKEVHHRVKNNLQLLLSMLNLQADLVSDPRTLEIIQDIQDRLRSIATVHQRLSQSLDSGRVDLEQYIRRLVNDLFRSHKTKSAFLRHSVELPPIELHSNDVMLCGLVVNELVTNAIKHGFPDGRTGEVRVIGKNLDDRRFSIVVADDGIGFPADQNFAASSSLGLQLVHVLAEQLEGRVELRPGRGTHIELTFELER
jgi:two-component sensor histidine kinase/PAS domain-containing protein